MLITTVKGCAATQPEALPGAGKTARLRHRASWLGRIAVLVFTLASSAVLARPDIWELDTWVASGSVGNRFDIVVRHTGDRDGNAVEDVRIAIAGAPRYLTNIRIDPSHVASLRPDEERRIAVTFDVSKDAPQKQVDTLRLLVTAANGAKLDFPKPTLTVRFVEPAAAHPQAPGKPDLVDVQDVVGLHVTEVEARLNAAGLIGVYVGGNPAPEKVQEYTAQDQDPKPGGPPVPRGSKVTVTMHSEYVAPAAPVVAIVNVVGLTQPQAEDRLKSAMLVPDYVGGNPARTKAEEYTVEWQKPPAGGPPVPRNSPVTLAIRSAFVEPSRTQPVPPPPPPQTAPPPQAAPAPQIAPPPQAAPPPQIAPPPQPAPSQASQPDPTCMIYTAGAKGAADSGRLDEALNLYVQARNMRCPGLDNEIARLQGVKRENEQRARQCDELIQRGNQVRNTQPQEALNIYSQARNLRCNAPGLDNEIARLQGVIQQNQQQARQCNDLIQRGNQVRTNQPQEALSIYSQARNLRCNAPGLDNEIARLQGVIQQQQQQAQQCSELIQRGNQANSAGRLQEALNAYRQAQQARCNAPWLDNTIANLDSRLRQSQAPRQAASPAKKCWCPPDSSPQNMTSLLGQTRSDCVNVRTRQVVQPICQPAR